MEISDCATYSEGLFLQSAPMQGMDDFSMDGGMGGLIATCLIIHKITTAYLRVLVEKFSPEQNTTQTIRLIHG